MWSLLGGLAALQTPSPPRPPDSTARNTRHTVYDTCTVIIVHAYTTITIHVSYIVGLVFLGGEAPQVSREVWGGARPPNSDHITNFHFTLQNQNFNSIVVASYPDQCQLGGQRP